MLESKPGGSETALATPVCTALQIPRTLPLVTTTTQPKAPQAGPLPIRSEHAHSREVYGPLLADDGLSQVHYHPALPSQNPIPIQKVEPQLGSGGTYL